MASPEARRLFNEMRPKDENNRCFECRELNPQWASVTYGIWLCLNCAGEHRSLGTHLSFVRSLTMDAWKEQELKKMANGGNRKAKEFFKSQMDWNSSTRIKDRYNCKAAALYKDKIATEATGGKWTPAAQSSASKNYVSSVIPSNKPQITIESNGSKTSNGVMPKTGSSNSLKSSSSQATKVKGSDGLSASSSSSSLTGATNMMSDLNIESNWTKQQSRGSGGMQLKSNTGSKTGSGNLIDLSPSDVKQARTLEEDYWASLSNYQK